MSDMVYVVDEGGYIGEAVKQEVEYARRLGREIMYFSDFERNGQLEG